jgi:transposase
MKLMLEVRADGRPVSVLVAAANHAENTLLEPLIEQGLSDHLPRFMLADKAYDDDPRRTRMAERGVMLLAPHRKNRVKPKAHDGRSFRRYAKRYIVERTNAWLSWYRRLSTRWEYYSFIYEGFVTIACLITTINGL